MLLRNGKIPGELGVSFSPRLQNALSIAKQNKTPCASVSLTPDHQHKETLSKSDEVQEKSNSIVETPVRPKTSKVTVQDPSTGIVRDSSIV